MVGRTTTRKYVETLPTQWPNILPACEHPPPFLHPVLPCGHVSGGCHCCFPWTSLVFVFETDCCRHLAQRCPRRTSATCQEHPTVQEKVFQNANQSIYVPSTGLKQQAMTTKTGVKTKSNDQDERSPSVFSRRTTTLSRNFRTEWLGRPGMLE